MDGFFRLFGDADGDGDVDGQDRDLFRSAFGTTAADAGYLWYFDFDGDGDVDGLDNGQFNRRFGQSVSVTTEAAGGSKPPRQAPPARRTGAEQATEYLLMLRPPTGTRFRLRRQTDNP